MTKMTFYTIAIDDNCYDLPKEMPVPQLGTHVFIDGKVGKVDNINYHINDGHFVISIYTEVIS
jgi:hypothetical protein